MVTAIEMPASSAFSPPAVGAMSSVALGVVLLPGSTTSFSISDTSLPPLVRPPPLISSLNRAYGPVLPSSCTSLSGCPAPAPPSSGRRDRLVNLLSHEPLAPRAVPTTAATPTRELLRSPSSDPPETRHPVPYGSSLACWRRSRRRISEKTSQTRDARRTMEARVVRTMAQIGVGAALVDVPVVDDRGSSVGVEVA